MELQQIELEILNESEVLDSLGGKNGIITKVDCIDDRLGISTNVDDIMIGHGLICLVTEYAKCHSLEFILASANSFPLQLTRAWLR
jgi:serine/threonine protein kinase